MQIKLNWLVSIIVVSSNVLAKSHNTDAPPILQINTQYDFKISITNFLFLAKCFSFEIYPLKTKMGLYYVNSIKLLSSSPNIRSKILKVECENHLSGNTIFTVSKPQTIKGIVSSPSIPSIYTNILVSTVRTLQWIKSTTELKSLEHYVLSSASFHYFCNMQPVLIIQWFFKLKHKTIAPISTNVTTKPMLPRMFFSYFY
jgi:hypothetical protein